MAETMQPVTGTSSIVGFAHQGHHDDHHHHYNHFNPGISDKDQGYASTVDAGERTRDILHGQRFSDEVNARQHTDSQVAVEKVGAAGVIATERNATVLQVQSERNTSELRIQAERIRADQAAQAERINLAQTMAMSDMRMEQQKQNCDVLAAIAKCCCDTQALIKEVETNRVRDDLAQCRAELLAAQRGN